MGPRAGVEALLRDRRLPWSTIQEGPDGCGAAGPAGDGQGRGRRGGWNAGFGSAHSALRAGGVLEAALDGGLDLLGLVEVGDQRGEIDVDLAHCVL